MSRFDRVESGDLYALLSVCTKEDLDPIVQIILKKVSNFLSTDEKYKKYSPDHTKYHKLIGDELRLFGGNSLSNVFRGQGPGYDEIVFDVCKKLDVPCQEGRIVENEANLLDLFAAPRWAAMSEEEKKAIAEDVREGALEGYSGVSGVIGSVGGAALTASLISGPAGWAALGMSLMSSSFKVTIPCVLHIAYLRRRYLEKSENIKQNFRKSSASLQGSSRIQKFEFDKQFILEEESGKELLSLKTLKNYSQDRSVGFSRDKDAIAKFNELLLAVPSLVTTLELQNHNYMLVEANGQLVKATGGGFRGLVVDSANKVKEHARLFEADTLSTLVNSTAIITLASTLLAQKHLADISRKLSDIKQEIDNIRTFQKNERRALVSGTVHYLEQLAVAVFDGLTSSTFLSQIERSELDMLRVQYHILADVRELENDIKKAEPKKVTGVDGINEISTYQQDLTALYSELVICVRARACALQLLSKFPDSSFILKNRQKDILAAIDEISGSTEIYQTLRALFHEASGFWKGDVNQIKLSLKRENEVLMDSMQQMKDEVRSTIEAITYSAQAAEKGMRFIVKIKNGTPVAAQLL
ncbi:hypothetical protein [Thalassospira marina]|uniref:Uncharacterized protein n=1 Tax=Thalassospira marina TaxID=2048283 RepID=A0ABN5FBD7_9PROT|nr:hypothetical protein [Thalassospira marina]AUG52077.1 hypothetical protein CSC3H3_04575 [Thalassospira marina]